MDKPFWFGIKAGAYAPPAQPSLAQLTEELFGYIGNPDPEVRDQIAYEVFANWLEQGRYSPEQLRPYILRLIVNLQEGLGERETDSVFLRSFSALFLGEIVNRDNEHPFLDRDEIETILTRALEYLENEQDPRGYIPGKGWAHALAHTADLLFVLARSRQMGREDLARILDGVRAKLLRPTDWVYVHGEDDRLARAARAVAERKILDRSAMKVWLVSFSDPETHTWVRSYEDDDLNRAFTNCRAFLRGYSLAAARDETGEDREGVVADCLEAVGSLRQF